MPDLNRTPELDALRAREKTLTEKIAKLKTGELKAEEYPGDGRQEEAVMRNEKILRDIKKAIEAINAKTKSPK